MIFIRIVFFIGVFGLSFYTSEFAQKLLVDTFNYQNPSEFFVEGWSAMTLAFLWTTVFWGGVVFGALGKKIDFIFYALILALALWQFADAPNVTTQMYWGLLGAAVLGNIIGYLLKLTRQRFAKI